MKRLLKALLPVGVLFASAGSTISADDPKVSVVALFDLAKKGDVAAVSKSFANLPTRNEAKVTKESTSFVDYVRKATEDKKVLDTIKIDQDLGVVVFLDKPGDPDPIYMQKQDDGWKVLSIGDYEPKVLGFDEGKLARLDALKAWFKEEKRAIRAQQTK